MYITEFCIFYVLISTPGINSSNFAFKSLVVEREKPHFTNINISAETLHRVSVDLRRFKFDMGKYIKLKKQFES